MGRIMSESSVTLTIDGIRVSVPGGTLLVDAAKRAGVDIPVFCYHPKLHSVGMCRMCLVEVGRPARDRASGEPILDEEGESVLNFGPNLETICFFENDVVHFFRRYTRVTRERDGATGGGDAKLRHRVDQSQQTHPQNNLLNMPVNDTGYLGFGHVCLVAASRSSKKSLSGPIGMPRISPPAIITE